MEDRRENGAFARALAILALLRRRQWAAFSREAARDPVGALALAALAALAVAGARTAVVHDPSPPPWRFGVALAATAAWAVALHGAAVRPDTTRLSSGPLHPLLAEPGVADAWSRLQVAAALGLAAIVLAATLLDEPLRAFSLAGAAALGLIAAAPLLRTGVSAGAAARRMEPRRPSASLTGPLLVARMQARLRRAGLPAAWISAGLLVLGALAARTALVNNPGPQVATVLLMGIGLVSAAPLDAPDVELLRFLARAPGSLTRLLAASCLPAAAATAIALAGAGLLIGLGPGVAVGTAAAVLGLLAAAAVLKGLHALGGRPRFAPFATALDLALVAAVAATFAPAAPVWTAARGVLLWRAAERGRWLSP